MEAKGKTLMKVVSIVMIVGSVLGIIAAIIMLIGGGAVAAIGGASGLEGSGVVGGTLIGLSIVTIVVGVIELLAGIFGVKECGNVEMAPKCFKYGIVLIILVAVEIIFSIVTGGFKIMDLLGFLFPVLYTLAANMNKQTNSITD
ncbi:MAG: hypothetical protein RRX92_05230 [Lachnospiraceae bacterium]